MNPCQPFDMTNTRIKAEDMCFGLIRPNVSLPPPSQTIKAYKFYGKGSQLNRIPTISTHRGHLRREAFKFGISILAGTACKRWRTCETQDIMSQLLEVPDWTNCFSSCGRHLHCSVATARELRVFAIELLTITLSMSNIARILTQFH